VAREIGKAQPTFVGLQEAFSWYTGPLGSSPASKVVGDQAQSLLDDLTAQGLHYAPVATLTDSDFEQPSNLGFDVRLVDHDVLLARTDIPGLTLANIQANHFATLLSGNIFIGKITLPRGWISVDATINGKTFRVVTTHLETITDAVRIAQANEILEGPLQTKLPTVFFGDLNTNADSADQAYTNLTGGGLVDVWSAIHPGDPGYTSPLPGLTQRIDLVFLHNKATPKDIVIIGTADRTPAGVWYSDHAGLVATVLI
jgi:hypothetical protein